MRKRRPPQGAAAWPTTHSRQVADPTHPLLSADRVELQTSRRLGQRLTHSRAFRRQTEKRLQMD